MSKEAMHSDYDGFHEVELVPRADDHSGFIYILIFSKDGVENPFYVGQTTRFHGRMDDYFWADDQAPTDFKVGEAVRYFCGVLGGKVYARYKQSSARLSDEKTWEARLRASGAILLNGKAYNYKTAGMKVELHSVHALCDEIAVSLQSKNSAAQAASDEKTN